MHFHGHFHRLLVGYLKISLESDSNTNWHLMPNTLGAAEAHQQSRSGFGHYPGLRNHAVMLRVSQWHGWCGPGMGETTKPFSEVGRRGVPAQYPPPAVLISLANLGRADDWPHPTVLSLYPQTKRPFSGLEERSFGDLSSAQVTTQCFAGWQCRHVCEVSEVIAQSAVSIRSTLGSWSVPLDWPCPSMMRIHTAPRPRFVISWRNYLPPTPSCLSYLQLQCEVGPLFFSLQCTG